MSYLLGTLVFPILVGIGLGGYSSSKGWTIMKTVLVSIILGTLIGMLGIVVARADDQYAVLTLRRTTVHISIGSGSVIEAPSGKKYLLTNAHVCKHGSHQGKMWANYENGKLISGKITKSDLVVDLCATQLSEFVPAIRIGKTLSLNQTIYTRGYPYGILSETKGQVLGVKYWDYTYEADEDGCFRGAKKVFDLDGSVKGCTVLYIDNTTDMYVRPGSSGSPVVDSDGNLVGVVSSWNSEDNLGGMVTLDTIKDFLKDL